MNADGTRKRDIYGVLTDYDLSSWTKALKKDYTRTSQQRTGTPPYMAEELLKGTNRTHLYRHDVESLFYIMLLMCGRHAFGYGKDSVTGEEKLQVTIREGKVPYQNWFCQPDYNVLGSLKFSFFTGLEAIELSPAFKDFRPWLRALQMRFSLGLFSKGHHTAAMHDRGDPADQNLLFDDETLGGRIDYPSLIEPVPLLTGKLEGLVIRYNPPPSPPPAPVSATSADA